MEEPKPKRPWWRKKRWRLVIATWLALPVLYVASGGPPWYAFNRYWVPDPVAASLIAPYWVTSRLPHPLADAYAAYLRWWSRLALRHNGSNFRRPLDAAWWH